MNTTFNAVLDASGNVIGYTAADAREIEVAGAITTDGAPVNVRTHRVSKSQVNRAKICAEMPSATAHEHAGRIFYTLEG